MNFEVGQGVKVVGPGVHCGDRYKGCEGVIWFIDQHGVLVDFSETEGQSSKWFPPESLKLVLETKEQHIDLSGFEVSKLYVIFRAVEMINNGYTELERLGLAANAECDIGAIFDAIQRELPLRRAMIEAIEGDSKD